MASPEQSDYLDERSENRDEHKKGEPEPAPWVSLCITDYLIEPVPALKSRVTV